MYFSCVVKCIGYYEALVDLAFVVHCYLKFSYSCILGIPYQYILVLASLSIMVRRAGTHFLIVRAMDKWQTPIVLR